MESDTVASSLVQDDTEPVISDHSGGDSPVTVENDMAASCDTVDESLSLTPDVEYQENHDIGVPSGTSSLPDDDSNIVTAHVDPLGVTSSDVGESSQSVGDMEPVDVSVDLRARLETLEQALSSKEQQCVMLEQQLIQANRQVETCYYQMEEHADTLRHHVAELDRKDQELMSARRDLERLDLLESEKRHLSEMVAKLTHEVDVRTEDATVARNTLSQIEKKLVDLTNDNMLLKDHVQTLASEHSRSRDLVRTMEEASSRGEIQYRVLETELANVKDRLETKEAEMSNLMTELANLQDEYLRSKEQLHASESECQAHKEKASEIYSLYQQLQEENMGLVSELKDLGAKPVEPIDNSDIIQQCQELSTQLEAATQQCRERDSALSERASKIQMLEHRIKSLETELRQKSGTQEQSNEGSQDAMRRLQDEIRIIKINNAGLVSEISSLKAQINDKNARIDQLNCEIMTQKRKDAPLAENGFDVDLEAYMGNRMSGMSFSESSKSMRMLSVIQEAAKRVLNEPFYRKCFMIYVVILHILMIALLMT
ncbi:putative integral membrane protein [Babesia bovis T2Bo]|uniref:Golgin-84 n=1 Tax=Babesia bovis TaxID=5865 RepID=A7AN15_BABBO|nr:putative integral membrane protein [Babesia bovis T2Bo]EDO07949.1 putative integral membrane protein [Babesia bovis T2Bo]|eukprot:XP_001611517.1 hypothetical protein [Babesia bovis T2Bo]